MATRWKSPWSHIGVALQEHRHLLTQLARGRKSPSPENSTISSTCSASSMGVMLEAQADKAIAHNQSI
jgi:hypothetical protein